MIIQINTDNNIEGSERQNSYFTKLIADELDKFNDRITRVEVHLSDENSHKNTDDDHRCMIEARLEGMQPVAVTCHANSTDQAMNGAIIKLKTSLETITGRLKNY